MVQVVEVVDWDCLTCQSLLTTVLNSRRLDLVDVATMVVGGSRIERIDVYDSIGFCAPRAAL